MWPVLEWLVGWLAGSFSIWSVGICSCVLVSEHAGACDYQPQLTAATKVADPFHCDSGPGIGDGTNEGYRVLVCLLDGGVASCRLYKQVHIQSGT